MLTLLPVFAQVAGENDEPPNPIRPELSEAFWAAVFFLLIWALMKYVLLPPIRRMIAERDESMRLDHEAADSAREQLATTRREYDEALSGARAEAGHLLEAARAEADAHRAELVRQADSEVAQLRERASAEIQAARRTALESLHDDVVDLAIGVASLLVPIPLDRARAAEAVERALAERRN